MFALVRRARNAASAARRDPGMVLLLIRTYLLLVVTRAVITAFSLRRISSRLGVRGEETPHDGLSAAQQRYARRIAWSIHKMAPYTPTNSNCYPQALTAWWLLHRKNVPSTVYYGAAFKDGKPELDTHVWVRCGTHTVSGAPVHRRFGVVATFADGPLTMPASISPPPAPASPS